MTRDRITELLVMFTSGAGIPEMQCVSAHGLECLDEIETLQLALKISSSKDVAHVAMNELDDVLAENERFKAEVVTARERAWRLESELACTADLLNTWCRESGVAECKDPYGKLQLRNAVDRLWSKLSGRIDDLRTEAERLRERLAGKEP